MMWTASLPPFVVFFAFALLAPLLKGKLKILLLLAPLWGGFNLYMTHAEAGGLTWQIGDLVLQLYHVDKLSLLFGYLFHIAAFIALIYSLHVKDHTQQVCGLLYAGSALGAVFAGDLLTVFMFWELLAITSAFLIWARRTPEAIRAANRYVVIQVLSGVLLLAGSIMLYQQTGSLKLEYVGLDGSASWLIFIALGIKCGFPFLHTWLTDAYPLATPTGTLYLSAFTTKVAVYLLARMFPGEPVLIYIGAAMTCFPIFYAVIENDLRKVLAYSLINQLGFMVCGIGIGTALALNGAVAHAFNDVIFKGLLFMTMGAVLTRVGHVNGSHLGGLYKSMPRTTVFCLVGAASISAFPLFSGFVSKSMVMAALLEQDQIIVWLMLLFASAGVFHHAGIKIPFFAFFAHDSGMRPKEAPVNMQVAMGLAAVLCIAIGVNPQWLYQMLPWELDYTPYDLTHTLTQIQLLFFSALAFVWLNKQGLYPPELRSVNLDAEWFYRKLLPKSGRKVTAMVSRVRDEGRQLGSSVSEQLEQREKPAPTGTVTIITRRMAWVFIAMMLLALTNLIF